jgi:hypothetical protein
MITAVALMVATATCGEQQTPTSPLDPGIAASQATATLVSPTITHTLLTSGNDPVNQKIYTTASISPAPNALITVAVMGHRSSSAAPSPTLSGGGMTAWTEVTTITFDAVATPRKRLTIFRAMSPSPGSGPLTITFSATVSNAQWIVSQWDGVEMGGVNGADAIGQIGSDAGDGVNGLAVTLGAFGTSSNVAYGVFGVRSSGIAVTPGAGFTEISEQPSGETPADLQAEWAVNQPTIDASWSGLNGSALGLEIKAGGGSGVSASLSTLTAAPLSIDASTGASVSTITVTAIDTTGTLLEGATVVLEATGTGNTLTQPAGPTDANGVATGTLFSTVAEEKSVSAIINGVTIDDQDTVNVGVGPFSPDSSLVSVDPSTILVGSGTANISVTVTDYFRNPVSGAMVQLSASGSGNTLTPAGPTATGPDGIVTGTLSSTVPETKIVSAEVDGTPITQTDTVLVTDQLPADITHTLLAASTHPTNQKVYTTASISPAPDALITIAVLGHRSSGANPSPTVTGGGMPTWDEVATVTFDPLSGPLKRATIYRAMSASPGSGPITITFPSSVSNAQWIVSQWEGVETSGVNGAGAIGQIGTDAGDGVNGLAVTLAAFGSANNVAYGVFGVRSSELAVTPGAGFTEISEQPSGETPADLHAEWAVNQPTIDASWSGLNGGALGLEIKAGGPPRGVSDVSASQSTVSASPATITASNGASAATVTVTAKDAAGNPVSDVMVELTVAGTGNTYPSTGTTDANGVWTGTLSSTVAEEKIVSATIDNVPIDQQTTVTVDPGPPDASTSMVSADPSTILMGSGSSTITVTALDAHGNPISGATAVLSATGSGSVLTQPAAPTDASGVATGTLSSTVAETAIVSATIDGIAITQTAAVLVTDQAPAAITHTLLAAGSHPTNQKIYTTASISPAPNALITVAVMGHRSSGAPPSPTLSGGGMTAWTEVATVTFDPVGAPLKRGTIYRAMSASPGSGPLTITFSATVSNAQWIVSQWEGVETGGVNGADAIGQIGLETGDGVNGLAVALGGFGTSTNVAYGVFGVRSSELAVTPGAGFTEISEQPSGETPADLQAESAVNQPTIDASWAGLNGAALGLEIKAGVAGPVEPVATVEVSPQLATVAVGSTLQLTAATLDAGGELLFGRTITWSSDAPQFATVSPSGLVTGVAVGSATISATSEGKVGTSSVTVTATPEPVASVEVTPGAASLGVGSTVQLTATPKNAAGQPLTGRVVTWGSDAEDVATVDATGFVTAVAVGAATITATSEGQSGNASITVTTSGTSALVGEWSEVLPAPIVLVHQNLLLDGRMLSFGKDDPQVWDPVTGIFTAVPLASLLFCAGHDYLPDGRLLVTGGGTGDGRGHMNSDIFDHTTTSWIAGPPMTYARWYPTNTTLPSGEVLTVAGQDENGAAVPIPEIGDGTSWRPLTGASLSLPNYPRNFVAPDGRIFTAGSSRQSRWLDVSGAGSWSDGPRMNFGSRSYGSAVMYEPGKILYAGGNSSPTNTAEIIDLNQSNPQWTYTGSLTFARWNLNATALPDGQVLVTGGVNGDRSDPTLAVYAAEMWNPDTGVWTTMASSSPLLLRGYHSTTLLLPDGRLVHSGGGDGGGTPENLNFQIYSPPYLFKGARPTVTGATPDVVGYGQPLFVETPDGADITKVTLIRFGSVTHAFDQAQRLVSLSFSQVSGGLSITLPASSTAAPPGPYMLFLVNGNGVPSVARIMLLQ